MGVLRVLHPGPLATIQDLGREGWAHLGVPSSGAADPLSLRFGNRLVGNADGAAAIELTLAGGAFVFEDPARIAVVGAEMPSIIEGEAPPSIRNLPLWTAVSIRAGDTVRIGSAARGARAYLCVGGGVLVKSTLGSASTLVTAGLGGLEGRPLASGDTVRFGGGDTEPPADEPGPRAAALVREHLERRALRASPGAHASWFDRLAAGLFWTSPFAVSDRSDRMGLRLSGPDLSPSCGGTMITEGMPCGAVQVPDDGRPIVLLVDRPTTGGYPAIACVATVDLPALGQCRPRDKLRFVKTEPEEARRAFDQLERRFDAEVPPR